MPYIIAIDGPAGAGKTTIARGVADRLGITRVDTGAIYRCVTLVALEKDITDAEALAALLPALEIRFEGSRVFIGAREVTKPIRSRSVTENVSRVSAMPAVRVGLLELQRRLAKNDPAGAVLEGRDIGTVVFPDAEVKVFLSASAEERARRRTDELRAAGEDVRFEDILAAIQERDRLDSGRAVAPLRAADDAVLVDSTGKTVEQVIDEVVSVVRSRVDA